MGWFRGKLGWGALVLALVVVGILLARQPWLRKRAGLGSDSDDKRCGWTARGNVKLDRDLTDCPRNGVRLASQAVLDCDGHEIRGRGAKTSANGVRLDGAHGAEVRNCRISGFARGVRIRGGRGNRVVESQLDENGYGIDVAGETDAGASENHVLAGNQVRRSVKDGIHIGAGSARIRLEGNTIEKSGQEGLYVQSCDGCEVIGNTVDGAPAAALDLKDSSNGVYAGNVVRGGMVKIRGDSSQNLFVRNELIDSGFVFSALDEGAGDVRAPHDNEIRGGAVAGRKVCLRFKGAYDNRVVDVLVLACNPFEERPFGARASSGNQLGVRRSTGDLDGDGSPDYDDPCTDSDGDGFGDPGFLGTCPIDRCPTHADPGQEDTDHDGVGDACDVCSEVADPVQRDGDADGTGDACARGDSAKAAR